jgi:hypothetical protein
MQATALAPRTRVDLVNLGNTHYLLSNGWSIKPNGRLKDRVYGEVPERAIIDAIERPGRPARLAIVPAGSPYPAVPSTDPQPVVSVETTAMITPESSSDASDDEDIDLGGGSDESDAKQKVDLTKEPMRRGAQLAPDHQKGIVPFDRSAEVDPLNPAVGTLPQNEGEVSPGMDAWSKRTTTEQRPTRRRSRR